MWKNKKMRDRIDNIEIINLHSQISKILYIERDIDDRGVSINNENKSTISLKILGMKLATN